MGYSDEMVSMLDRRSVSRNAPHLLPHLKPNMRVLDFGCGPGTISIGLADAVAPGELHGVDMEESQITLARDIARAGDHANAKFSVGDVTELPFEDSYFDVVHGHAVLMHTPDVDAVLRELLRVLKPGGIISLRELITESSFTEPHYGITNQIWDAFEKRLIANGGNPNLGKELKSNLHANGFKNVDSSGTFESFSSPDDIEFSYQFLLGVFFDESAVEGDIARGPATRETFDGWRRAVDRWRNEPDAYSAFAWGEAIDRKPE